MPKSTLLPLQPHINLYLLGDDEFLEMRATFEKQLGQSAKPPIRTAPLAHTAKVGWQFLATDKRDGRVLGMAALSRLSYNYDRGKLDFAFVAASAPIVETLQAVTAFAHNRPNQPFNSGFKRIASHLYTGDPAAAMLREAGFVCEAVDTVDDRQRFLATPLTTFASYR